MNNSTKIVWFVLSSWLAMSGGCHSDVLPPFEEPEICDTTIITYQLNIKSVVETNCTYAGCHDGSSPGVFTTYDGMLPYLDNGDMAKRVLELRDMPPTYATGPKELSDEDFELMSCWLNNGYPRE